jgi:Tol biopolymer transport system component/predicted Ser/Thr protein kinase
VDLKPGDRLGAYEVVGLLGRGGMGAVYRAIDTRLNRSVAIKVVDEAFSERFQHEARAISSLNHPSVCTLYDVGANYLVMELIEGETLADRLKSGALPVERAVDYGGQIARALAAAHAKGVVHRDLKPANIMVTKSGVKVLDFGVAKVGVIPGETATMSRVIIGTPAYMAPEQLQGNAGDARSDVYAFGLILAEMLTGARPSHGTLKFPAHVSPRIARVVERCLSTDPDDRWQAVADAGWELTTVDPAPSAQPPPSNRERWIWAAAVLVLAAVAAALWLKAPALIESTPLRFEVPPPDNGRFSADVGVVSPAISPDGRTLAFAASVAGQMRVWIRPLDSDVAHVLAGTEGVLGVPFWSPDSRSLAFLAEGKLKRIAIGGGPPQIICDIPSAPGSGSWSSKNVILIGLGSAGAGALYRVSADGGAVVEFKKPDPTKDEDGLVFPEFLPDGDRFFYMAGVKNQKGNRIYIGSLSASESTLLAQLNSRLMYASPGRVMYVRERTLLAQRFDERNRRLEGDAIPVAEGVDFFNPIGLAGFSLSRNGVLAYHASDSVSQLAWINRAGIQTGVVGGIAPYQSVRLSPDGKRLAVDRIQDSRTNASDVHVFDLTHGTDTRVTSAIGSEFGPIWSPDGRRLVFAWDKDAPPYLHQIALDNIATTEPLVRPNGSVHTPGDWHPNGSFVAYEASDSVTSADVWILPMTGDRTPKALVKTRFNESAPRFSPEGRWIAYVSDEAGQPDVYVRPFLGPGEAHPISTGGGSNPRWRRDGRELFYVAGQRIVAVPVTTSPSFDVGAPKELFDRKPARIIDYDVAADGQTFLINSELSGPETKPINIVVNWMAALKK